MFNFYSDVKPSRRTPSPAEAKPKAQPITRRTALVELGNTIYGCIARPKFNEIGHGNHRRFSAQHTACGSLEMQLFDSEAERIEYELTMRAACCEHTPHLCRVLGAASLVEHTETHAHYTVPSESNPGVVHHVALDLLREHDTCPCPSTRECFHIRNARECEALRAATVPTDDESDAADDLSDADPFAQMFAAIESASDVVIGYPGENAKPEHKPDFSPDAIWRSKMPAVVDYFALWNED